MNDIKRTAEILFFAAVLLLSSGAFAPLWTARQTHDLAATGDARLQFFWLAIYAIVLVLLVPGWRRAVAAIQANKTMALMLLLCIGSASWSEEPQVALRKACALFGTTLLGLLFAVEFDVRAQSNILGASLAVAAIASVFASLLAPDLFRPSEFSGGAWNGVFSHKNLLGRGMSLGTLTFLSLERRGLASFVIAFAGAVLCFVVLLASHSKTALVVLLAVAVLAALLRAARLPWRHAAATFLFATLIALPAFGFAVMRANELAALLHRNVTLTGRARIWNFAELSFRQHPWLGYGYGSFWGIAGESRRALAFIRYSTPHAHNGFLDLGLQLGLLGVVLMLILWLATFLKRLRDFRMGAPARGLLFVCFFLLYNLTENSWLLPNSLLWIVFSAVVFSPSTAVKAEL